MIDYDPHNWTDHFFDIKGSLVREIFVRVLFCGAIALVAVLVDAYGHPLTIPSTIHSLAGLALGLLLVFRTNASYDRFWEGRKAWGGIVNDTRNLVRAARPFLERDPGRLAELVEWTAAFPYAAMNHLRDQRGTGPNAPAYVRQAEQAQHVPLAVAAEISECLSQARRAGLMAEHSQVIVDSYTGLLVQYLGICERIHTTPLPFAYVVHLRRALVLYFGTLPFAIVDTFHVYTLPAVLLMAYTFLGIEEIGVEIEDPFGEDENDLPLEVFCGKIEANLRGLL